MNPILLDFPHEFETERLFIRMPKPGDGKVVYPAIQASINELKQWLPFAQNKQSEEESEINTREAYIKFLRREDLRLHIFLKETGEFVGSSGLHNIDWDIPKFEIGYWVHTKHSGRGYGTEAAAGITNFAFHELKAKRVEIQCDAKNDKSRAIPEKLDFSLEGILKNDELSVDGKSLRDTCIYAKIKA
ncbi:GNAT family N-acetyltransferase [Virgibacillus sp. MSP4-1]|uniref:GNAT family N-acetyltransferase n=1 Tax=Virgibacillus sp. MSP4-1 TaxID=2700081 RepID=UPI0003A5803C|nr:GNAT family N-acetyltransferase [Virgibacillus sp. MSP4-1]QHS21879.1 GNAT family N-acetyltransferase [Virgibacillus sp. MSP4-1]